MTETVHSKYMEFFYRPPSAGRKTPIVTVCAKSSGVILGEIKWYGRWRQFCFFPRPMTLFNVGCMAEIREQIGRLKAEREASRAEAPNSGVSAARGATFHG